MRAAYWNTSNTVHRRIGQGIHSEKLPGTNGCEVAGGGGLWATGGGASMYFPQPSWQTRSSCPTTAGATYPIYPSTRAATQSPTTCIVRPARTCRARDGGEYARHFVRHAHHGRSGGAAESVPEDQRFGQYQPDYLQPVSDRSQRVSQQHHGQQYSGLRLRFAGLQQRRGGI